MLAKSDFSKMVKCLACLLLIAVKLLGFGKRTNVIDFL